jgi:5-amino-6-(5-phosphoribosylamino)uracil reductase
MSLDGCIDDISKNRLILSSREDFEEVDLLRSEQDAILVGAQTLRNDNPSLSIKNKRLQEKRTSLGKNPDLIKVTITSRGELDPDLKFFQGGTGEKVVYCSSQSFSELSSSLQGLATVVASEADEVDPAFVLSDLFARGVTRLLVEGGQTIHTLFIQRGLVDELRVAIAPFFVGDKGAPRFVAPGNFPFNQENHFELVAVEQLGDTAVLRLKKRT